MHPCQVCGQTAAADVRRCRVSWCGRYHHSKCVGGSVDARRHCPRHHCANCNGAIDEVESVFLACVRCDKLYHAAPECRPSPDSVILLDQHFDAESDRIVFVRCATHDAPAPLFEPLGADPAPSYKTLADLLLALSPTLLSRAPPTEVELESDSSSDAECAAAKPTPVVEKRKRPTASPSGRKRPVVTRTDDAFSPASSSSDDQQQPEPDTLPATAAKTATPQARPKPKKSTQSPRPVAKPSSAATTAKPIVAIRKPSREFEHPPIVVPSKPQTQAPVAQQQPQQQQQQQQQQPATNGPSGRRILHIKPAGDLKKVTPPVPVASVGVVATIASTTAATTAATAANAGPTAAESLEFEKNKQRLAEQRAQSQQTLLDSMSADFKLPKRKVEPEVPVKKERPVAQPTLSPPVRAPVQQQPPQPIVMMPRMTAWDCFFAERAPYAAEVLGVPITSPPVFTFLQQQWHALPPQAQQTYVAAADAHEHRRLVAADAAERQRFAAAHPEAFECPVCALFITEELFWAHFDWETERKARNALFRLSGLGSPPTMWKH
jgi:hypothetical protein